MGSCGGQGRSGELCGHHVRVQGEGSPCMGAEGGTEVKQVMGSLTLNSVLHHSHPITSWQWLVKGVHHRSAVPIGSPYGRGWD